MANTRIGSSFSCLAASLSSPFQRSRGGAAQLGLSQGLLVNQLTGAQLQIYNKVSWLDKSWQFKFIHGKPKLKGRFQKQHNALFVVSEDQSQYSELETAVLVPENNNNIAHDISSASNSSLHLSGSDGKPGLISFYNRPYRRDSETLLSNSERSQNSLLWFLGPTVLVASFIFPSLYLRKLLSIIFEDSLLTGNFSLEERLSRVCSSHAFGIWCYIALSAAICITYYLCGVISILWIYSIASW